MDFHKRALRKVEQAKVAQQSPYTWEQMGDPSDGDGADYEEDILEMIDMLKEIHSGYEVMSGAADIQGRIEKLHEDVRFLWDEMHNF